MSNRFPQHHMKESKSSVTHNAQQNNQPGGGKRRRFLITVLALATFIISLLFWYFVLLKPFDLSVRVQEANPVPGLPFKQGTLNLKYGEKLDSLPISTSTIFKQIPAGRKGQTAKLHFESPGYETIDTTFSLSENFLLPIRRDGSISRLYGSVKDEHGNGLSGAEIIVQNSFSVPTDKNGLFSFLLPIERQRLEQPIRVNKDGFQEWDSTVVIQKKEITIVLKAQ